MKRVRVCPECGVPKSISRENRWQNNGAILTFDKDKDTARERSAFYEVDGLNGLFQNIEAMIGKSIFRIVIEARRKDILGLLEEYLSGIRGVMARSIGRRIVYNSVATMGATFGLGHFEVRDIRAGDHVTIYCRNVYSEPLLAGDLAAAFNALERLPAAVDFEETANGLLCTISRGAEDETISSRLQPEYIAPKPGSVRFDRCSKCDTPLYLKEVIYDHEEGIITDRKTGRRMTFLSTSNLEAIFKELEVELGEDIIPVILEAQKDYTKSALRSEEIESETDIRSFLAIRGLGELTDCRLDDDHLEAVVENAYPYLLVAGLLHGMFEIRAGRAAKASYTKGDDESLRISIEAS
ncbi:MAG: hypothetical protein AB1384_06655 [Actinomycetota bacterium]